MTVHDCSTTFTVEQAPVVPEPEAPVVPTPEAPIEPSAAAPVAPAPVVAPTQDALPRTGFDALLPLLALASALVAVGALVRRRGAFGA